MTPRQPHQEEIIIFTRYPRAGQVKTRLIPRLGAEGAARLQHYLTEQTLDRATVAATRRPARLSLWYTGGSAPEMTAWLGTTLRLRAQQGTDLGACMAMAFQTAWAEGTRRAVILGADCPGLSADLITRALAKLEDHDLVLGPAHDGGYYLIGLRRDLAAEAQAALLQDITWGSASVFRDTMARATAANLTISTLQKLHDIDRPEDLHHLHHHPHPQ